MKNTIVFMCDSCGEIKNKWQGKCSSCQSWNSFQEKNACSRENLSKKKINSPKSLSLNNISIQENTLFPTGSKEFDRVVGGGISKKSIILLSGPPGVGKSTLITHIVSNMRENILYVSGEESISQVAARFKRIRVNNDLVSISTENNITSITDEIISLCNVYDVTFVVLGHVIKDGSMAGPKFLEHMVDVVLFFEYLDEENVRLLRCSKNRFGTTGEVGLFQMGKKGQVKL